MAKSNATRHLIDEDGTGEGLNVVINIHAKQVLERLAACYGVTQREAIERLVLHAERAALDRVAALPAGHADYYAGRSGWGLVTLRSNGNAPTSLITRTTFTAVEIEDTLICVITYTTLSELPNFSQSTLGQP